MNSKPVESFGVKKFISEESIGGVILIISTLVAVIWANSSFYDLYHHIWHDIVVGFVWGDVNVTSNIHHWINDGLMALFFFTVGLEIKREIMGGELSSFKKASLPIAAALGGMVLPAIIYALVIVNNPEFINGWGIPMATDIAFALGLLAMLGKRVNINIKIFLTALAIADDLGAVLVIAFFYTESINFSDLFMGLGFIVVLIVANLMGVRRTVFYAVVGFLGVWLAFIFSGVHATIAGVLIALTIPARTKIDETSYINQLRAYISKFEKAEPNQVTLLTKQQAHILSDIEVLNDKAHTPLQKLEHAMHPVSTYFILPLFALSNAGVHIEGNIADMLFHPISLGIIAGLVLGKALGISIFSWIMVKLKLANLPEGVSWSQIIGVACLAGIGFTMSMFISELAFASDMNKQIAKVGIFEASIIAAFIGMVLLARSSKAR